jgi:hypothetical protein
VCILVRITPLPSCYIAQTANTVKVMYAHSCVATQTVHHCVKQETVTQMSCHIHPLVRLLCIRGKKFGYSTKCNEMGTLTFDCLKIKHGEP